MFHTMKVIIGLMILGGLSAFPTLIHAQSDPLLRHAMVRVNPVTDYEAFKPSPLPDRINLTWNDDPATTQAVSWRTDAGVERAFAQIAISTEGPLFWHSTQWAKTQSLVTNLGKAHYHTVTFRDLEPDTEYIYRVGDGMNWSEWFHFRTASNEEQPFSFVYFGDIQEDIRSQSSRVIRRAFRDASDARFFIYGGDLVDNAHNDGEWGEWFEAHGFISASVPLVPSPGNHEHDSGSLSDQWRLQFALPKNGPEDLMETTYYFDYQNARIISLNSAVHVSRGRRGHGFEAEYIQPLQTEWLEEVLKNNPSKWTIVVFHHPVFSPVIGRDEFEIREQWKPLFDKYQVDLVLTAHDHSYSRTNAESRVYPFKTHFDDTAQDYFDPNSGTVYVNSHAGSKTMRMDRADWMARAGEDLQMYQIIQIDGDTLYYEAKTANGLLYDAFLMTRRDGAPNEIIDKIPEDVDEILRGEDSILPDRLRPWFYHERRFVDPPRR